MKRLSGKVFGKLLPDANEKKLLQWVQRHLTEKERAALLKFKNPADLDKKAPKNRCCAQQFLQAWFAALVEDDDDATGGPEAVPRTATATSKMTQQQNAGVDKKTGPVSFVLDNRAVRHPGAISSIIVRHFRFPVPIPCRC